MKIEITSRSDQSVLFACEAGSVKLAVEAAVKATVSLQDADLQDADLQGADLQGADLRGADLRGAFLWGASLWGADLQGADLRGASLWGASLWGADLQGAKNITLAWHVHHEILWEVLTEPLEKRIAYIKSTKPPHEQATRLRLLKLIAGPLPEKMTSAAMAALHKTECSDCPWDGSTIFPNRIEP